MTKLTASQRHENWLWRMANHQNLNNDAFEKKFEKVYCEKRFQDGVVLSGELPLAENYIVFSVHPDRTFISPNPPEVATAVKGQREVWYDQVLRALTVGKAAVLHSNRRDYLRSAKFAGGYVHRQIHFEMPTDAASRWRDELIKALKKAKGPKMRNTKRVRAVGRAKC